MAKPKSPKSGGPTEDEDKVAVDVTPEDQSAEFDKTPPEPESDELVLPEPDAKPDTPIADTPQPDVPQDDDSACRWTSVWCSPTGRWCWAVWLPPALA